MQTATIDLVTKEYGSLNSVLSSATSSAQANNLNSKNASITVNHTVHVDGNGKQSRKDSAEYRKA